jgi:two-component system, NarL family, sensor histidine kinase UhpB
LFWIGLAFFVLLNAIVYWMLGLWLQPLQPTLKAIKRMEQGDLNARLPAFNLPEFDSIAKNFNLMGESLQKSTAENQRLALIAQQTADAVMIHDLQGNISFWNAAAQKIFGYAPEDIIGKSASTLIPKGQETDLAQNMRAINDRRNVENHDTQRMARDGRIVDVSISAAPLIDPQTNEVIGDICSMRDITERKQAESAMRKAELAENKLEENRQITHLIQRHIEDERRSLARELHDELGQYVTAIKTFAFSIASKTKEKAPEVEASAQTIMAAANHIYDGMHNIIRQLRPGSLDNLGLTETLKDTINNVQKQQPNLRIKLDLSGQLNELGESLNINIYRIVQECINNAIKHADAKNIEVKLATTKTGALQLTIKDDGRGMDINNVDQTNHFGLLGMRERVQGFKGSFNVDSEPNAKSANKGTTIYINIPQAVIFKNKPIESVTL